MKHSHLPESVLVQGVLAEKFYLNIRFNQRVLRTSMLGCDKSATPPNIVYDFSLERHLAMHVVPAVHP